MKKLFVLAMGIIMMQGCGNGAQTPPPSEEYYDAVVKELSSEKYYGRSNYNNGTIKAAEYIIGQLQELGVGPVPAEIIEKLQIIDDYGDMANITGIRTGDPERILNIQIDPRFNRGEFGNFKAGGGTEDRYQASATMSIKRNNLRKE